MEVIMRPRMTGGIGLRHEAMKGRAGDAQADTRIFRSDVDFVIAVLALRAEKALKGIPGFPTGFPVGSGRIEYVSILEDGQDMPTLVRPTSLDLAGKEMGFVFRSPSLSKFEGRTAFPCFFPIKQITGWGGTMETDLGLGRHGH